MRVWRRSEGHGRALWRRAEGLAEGGKHLGGVERGWLLVIARTENGLLLPDVLVLVGRDDRSLERREHVLVRECVRDSPGDDGERSSKPF